MSNQGIDRATPPIKFFQDAIEHCKREGEKVGWIPKHLRAEAFYGPQSQFVMAVEAWRKFAELRGALAANDLLSFAPGVHPGLTDATVNGDVMASIAGFMLAPASDFGSAFASLKSVFSTVADQVPVSTLDHEREWVKAALREFYCQDLLGTVGGWRCATFANANLDLDAPLHRERTPIFLANDKRKKGYVLNLVAERMPGPAIVTPHWWRIGSVPLTDDLVTELHRGFEKVLGSINDSERFQIRWWLEQDAKIGWPTAIADSTRDEDGNPSRANPSVNAAAACLALALAEPAEIEERPVLDQFAGVSAQLQINDVPPETTVDNWPVGEVGHVEQKCSDAHEARLDAFVLSEQCLNDNSAKLVETKGDHKISILGGETLGDVYECLRLANKDFVKAKLVHLFLVQSKRQKSGFRITFARKQKENSLSPAKSQRSNNHGRHFFDRAAHLAIEDSELRLPH